MSDVLRFRFDVGKFPHVLAYLLANVGPSTRLRIAKLLYIADRIHLVRHGRPIVGGRYVALQQGPVPSMAVDVLEDLEAAKAEDAEPLPVHAKFSEELARLVDVDTSKRYPEYSARAAADLSQLSRSDIAVLDEVVKRFGKLTPYALRGLTHKHAAWQKTPIPEDIDYALFFEDEQGADRAVLEHLLATQDDRELVERLWLTSRRS